jgi:hypothetical protein
VINEGNAITEASVGGKKVDDFDDDLSVLVSVTGVDLPVADVDLLVAGKTGVFRHPVQSNTFSWSLGVSDYTGSIVYRLLILVRIQMHLLGYLS